MNNDEIVKDFTPENIVEMEITAEDYDAMVKESEAVEIMTTDTPPEKTEEDNRSSYRKKIKDWMKKRKSEKMKTIQENNLSQEFIRSIAESIKRESPNPAWAVFETDLLMEFIRIAIHKHIKNAGGIKAFKESVKNEDELKEKIITVFMESPSAMTISMDQAMRINTAYKSGLELGGNARKYMQKLLKKHT